MKISLIQPSRNNLKYLKWSYDSIRKNQGNHEVEICVADDFSDDGTWDWCQEMMEKDSNFKAIRNEGPTRLGHTILYDRLVNEVASYDVCMIYHADMYLCPDAINYVERHLKDKTIVSLTRIEPPLHPPGPEKIIKDFGIEPEEFKEEELLEWITNTEFSEEYFNKTTEGIFAPWAFYKKDFQEIGGHDDLYAPQSKEDSDIFNRFHLNGIKFVQTWMGCVYHMTCRGSRFAGGAVRNPDGKVFMKNRETSEWLEQNERASRNFIRKWGHFVKHDEYLKPQVPPKYGVGIVIKNCRNEILQAIEPWCDRIYTDSDSEQYILSEQENTKFNLRDRCFSIHAEVNDNIQVRIDGNTLMSSDFGYIQKLSEIISDSGEIGTFNLGNLEITINNMETYENNLITN
mgnify:CR=1 FL=1